MVPTRAAVLRLLSSYGSSIARVSFARETSFEDEFADGLALALVFRVPADASGRVEGIAILPIATAASTGSAPEHEHLHGLLPVDPAIAWACHPASCVCSASANQDRLRVEGVAYRPGLSSPVDVTLWVFERMMTRAEAFFLPSADCPRRALTAGERNARAVAGVDEAPGL